MSVISSQKNTEHPFETFAEVTSGANLIARERERQVVKEGYKDSHDDAHEHCELADAAAVYLDRYLDAEACSAPNKDVYFSMAESDRKPLWPWGESTLKFSTPVVNLIKAGALIAAEIDRLVRLEHRLHPDKPTG